MEWTAGKGTTAMSIIGTTLGGLAVGGPVLNALTGCGAARCNEDHFVNRYQAAQQARISELETEVKLRDSNIYTDQKSLQLYQFIDSELRKIREELCQQKVTNQRTADSFALAQADLAAVKAELTGKIQMEAERRCCGDNSIVTYANATFYPKQVAGITTGTTTTPQDIYNPLPCCGPAYNNN